MVMLMMKSNRTPHKQGEVTRAGKGPSALAHRYLDPQALVPRAQRVLQLLVGQPFLKQLAIFAYMYDDGFHVFLMA